MKIKGHIAIASKDILQLLLNIVNNATVTLLIILIFSRLPFYLP